MSGVTSEAEGSKTRHDCGDGSRARLPITGTTPEQLCHFAYTRRLTASGADRIAASTHL